MALNTINKRLKLHKNIKPLNQQQKAHLYLLFVSFFLGLSFPFLKWSTDYLSIEALLAWRFFVAAAVCSLFIPRGILRNISVLAHLKPLVKGAFLMSTVLFLAFWLQIEGLKYTSASHCTFITAFYCVFTPLLSFLIGRDKLGLRLSGSILISFLGLYFLSYQPGTTFNYGDFLTLLCALCVSAHIIFTDKYSRQCDVSVLNAFQLWGMTFYACVLLAYQGFPPFVKHGTVPLLTLIELILFLGIPATALFFWVQTSQQKYTTPSYVALILLMEPVFGAIASGVILLERLSPRELFGAMLILSGLILSQLKFKKDAFSFLQKNIP